MPSDAKSVDERLRSFSTAIIVASPLGKSFQAWLGLLETQRSPGLPGFGPPGLAATGLAPTGLAPTGLAPAGLTPQGRDGTPLGLVGRLDLDRPDPQLGHRALQVD